jgi:hypothetical protein
MSGIDGYSVTGSPIRLVGTTCPGGLRRRKETIKEKVLARRVRGTSLTICQFAVHLPQDRSYDKGAIRVRQGHVEHITRTSTTRTAGACGTWEPQNERRTTYYVVGCPRGTEALLKDFRAQVDVHRGTGRVTATTRLGVKVMSI